MNHIRTLPRAHPVLAPAGALVPATIGRDRPGAVSMAAPVPVRSAETVEDAFEDPDPAISARDDLAGDLPGEASDGPNAASDRPRLRLVTAGADGQEGSLVTEYGLLAVVAATVAGVVIAWASNGALVTLFNALLRHARGLVGA